MRRRKAVSAVPVLIVFLAGACTAQQPPGDSPPDREAQPSATDHRKAEQFSLLAMAHTSRVDNPSHRVQGPPIKTSPWNGEQEGGPFSYSSIRCVDEAPLNNVATNLTTYNSRLPNSHSPASVRLQPLQFNVLDGGAEGDVEGTITLVACGLAAADAQELDANTPDNERDQIRFDWKASYKRTSPQEVAWSGTFEIKQGTGAYQGISGSGDLAGYFFCFGRCGQDEPFKDTQLTMIGSYNAPNIPSPAAGTSSPAASPTGSPATSPAASPTASPTGSPDPSPAASPTGLPAASPASPGSPQAQQSPS